MHKVIGWVADKLLTNKKIDIFLSSAHLKAISFPPFHLVSSWGDNAWCCNSWTQTNQDINLEDDVHQEMYICLAWNWKNIKNPSFIFVLKIPNWLGSRRFNQSCLEIPPWRETNHQLHRKSANSYEFSNTHHPSSPWCGHFFFFWLLIQAKFWRIEAKSVKICVTKTGPGLTFPAFGPKLFPAVRTMRGFF